MGFEDYVCLWGDSVVAHGADDVGGVVSRHGRLVFFLVCLGFSLIVMYDATRVRRHSGMQAKVLNMIFENLFKGHPISQRKLKEFLGHTPSQVLVGAVLGIMIACIYCQGCLVAT